MAVFFFYLDMCFLQNFTIANTLKLYGISDKFINWWINIYKTQKCILQSIFYRFSRVYIPWSDIEWIEVGTKQILISPRMGCMKAVSFGATNSWELKF